MSPLPEFLRHFPHRNLKPCGGASADCSFLTEKDAEGFNWLQKAFWAHDVTLHKAQAMIDEGKRIQAEGENWRKMADAKLAADLRAGDEKKLTLKERFYLWKAKVVFR